MTYAKLRCQITDGYYVRLNRDFTFDDLYGVLDLAIERKLLKRNKKIVVWIKGIPTKRIYLYTPK